ncbi:MAG: alpha-L-fucosidase [Clostridia bacterium]|nr:alpha-L-fucosidase [Clostridia bacterium]
MEYYSFIHFGINTINNVEWGKGSENIAAFNPKKLDTDQWCSVLKETGSKGVIITAKHHDGFCLWATKETDHCVTNTPFKKDIVKMLSDSCKKYGLEFGIYLSPWDRHEKTYGTEEYNDFYIRQLKELCTNYGEVFCFWFDGACGEGPNGKKQVYDWQRYYSTIRELQPNAVISVCGPDVRWIGNEAGKVRESEWSVVPADKEKEEAIMENSQQTDDGGKEVSKTDERDADLGSREVLRNHSKLVFKPAEADVSINLGWFWHGNLYYLFKRNRTAKDLADIYFKTVGGNATLLLNVPPDRTGLINKREVKTLEKFTSLINEPFRSEIKDYKLSVINEELTERAYPENGSCAFNADEWIIKASFSKEEKVSAVVIREDLRFSQRIESFRVFAKKNESYIEVGKGTVIGSKKILFLEKAVTTSELLFAVTGVREDPVIRDIAFYN